MIIAFYNYMYLHNNNDKELKIIYESETIDIE